MYIDACSSVCIRFICVDAFHMHVDARSMRVDAFYMSADAFVSVLWIWKLL